MAFAAFAPSSDKVAISAAISPLLGPVGHGPMRVGEHGREAPRRPLLLRPLAEETQHARVRRLVAPEPLEERLRSLGLAAHLPVEHRDLEEDARLLRPARRGELLLVERDEVIPHLLRGEEVDQRARRLGVPRRQVEHALVGGGGALLRLELLRVDAREAHEARDLLVLGGGLGRDVLDDLSEILVAPLLPVDALEQERRLLVSGVDLDGLLEAGDNLLRQRGELLGLLRALFRLLLQVGPSVSVGDLRRAHEERALERGVRRALRLVHVAGGQIPPARPLRLALLDRRLGRRVAGAHLEQPHVGSHGARVVEHLVVQHPRELGLERRPALGSVGEGHLHLQDPCDRVELTPRLVLAPRRLEELRELVGWHARVGGCREGMLDALEAHGLRELGPSFRVVGVVLQRSECFPNGLRAHPSPRKHRTRSACMESLADHAEEPTEFAAK